MGDLLWVLSLRGVHRSYSCWCVGFVILYTTGGYLNIKWFVCLSWEDLANATKGNLWSGMEGVLCMIQFAYKQANSCYMPSLSCILLGWVCYLVQVNVVCPPLFMSMLHSTITFMINMWIQTFCNMRRNIENMGNNHFTFLPHPCVYFFHSPLFQYSYAEFIN